MRSNHTTRWAACLAAGLAVLVVATEAHDFWLVPDAMRVGHEDALVLRGQTSSAFPTSESAVTVDRITSARVLGAADSENIPSRAVSGTSLVLTHRPATAGQKVVGVTLGWRHVKETAESFRRYLELEGAEDALKRYEQAGLLPTTDIIRRYAKYTKTFVEVGDGPRAFERTLEHPLEFVPLDDPATIAPGGIIRLRLLFAGQPLQGARVHTGRAPDAGAEREQDRHLTTGADGSITVPIDRAGLWNARTIHVVPAPLGSDANWEVHWASVVWQAR
jgi:hypothetical protein